MLDLGTSEGRIIAAAMRLAGERPWQEISLRQIAEAAGMTLAGLSEIYKSKGEILRAFVRQVDREVLTKAPAPRDGESARDALFEVVMARFDVLDPYRAALRSIADSGEVELALLKPMCSSQAWMLEAAGIDAEGPAGAIRTAGLASVYASVFRTWLDDDDPGLARTMAVLDRRLRRGETVMQGMDGVIGAARRVKSMLRSAMASRSERTSSGSEGAGDVPDPGGQSAPAG